MSPDTFFNLDKFVGDLRAYECEFCFGVFEEIGDRFNLAVRVERNANGAMIDRCQIGHRPAGMIFAYQRNAVAKFDILLPNTISNGAYLPQSLAEAVHVVVVTDDPHCRFIGARLERIYKTPAKRDTAILLSVCFRQGNFYEMRKPAR